MAPYMTPTRQYLASLYPLPELQRSEQSLQLRLQLARADEPRRLEDAVRLEHQRQHQGVRAHRPRSARRREPARRVVGARRTSRCRRRTSATTRGRSYAGNVVSVLSPSMTNEVLVSYSRLTLDNHFQDPSLSRRAPAASPSTASSRPDDQPVPADRHAARVGRQRPGRQPLGGSATTCTHTTTRCSSATS